MKLTVFITKAKKKDVNCMSESSIRQQLQMSGNAIVTRDLACFLRIGKIGKNKFSSFVTNLTETEKEKFQMLDKVDISI